MVFRRGQSVLRDLSVRISRIENAYHFNILMAAAIDGAKVQNGGGKRKEITNTRFVDSDTLTEYQRLFELNIARGTFVTTDDIKGKERGVKDACKGPMNDGYFLVEGVVQRVKKGINMVLASLGVDGGCELGVELGEFVAMLCYLLEDDAFGMAQEEEVEGFWEWGEFYLKIVVIGKEDAEVGGNDEAAELLMGNEVLANGTRAYTPMAQGLQALVYLIENTHTILIKRLFIFICWGEYEVFVFGYL